MDALGLLVARHLEREASGLAAKVAEVHRARRPDDLDALAGLDVSDDGEGRVLHLAAALAAGRPALFHGYLAWLKVVLASRGGPEGYLDRSLACLAEVLEGSLPKNLAPPALKGVEGGRGMLRSAPATVPSLLTGPHASLARAYLEAVLGDRRDEAVRLVLDAARDGVPVPDLYRDVLARAQAEVGRRWQLNEVHVAQEHLCSFVTQHVMSLLQAQLPPVRTTGRRVLATAAQGNLHAIGVRMVADCFAMSGWDAIQLGANTPLGSLERALGDLAPDVVLISAQLAVHVRPIADLIEMLGEEGAGARVPVLVGGPPFDTVPDLWRVVGADAYAPDGPAAVEAAARLVA